MKGRGKVAELRLSGEYEEPIKKRFVRDVTRKDESDDKKRRKESETACTFLIRLEKCRSVIM